MDEFLASLQYIKSAGDRGVSRWRAFWGLTDDNKRFPVK
jgi:hypothetical protein